MLSLWTFTLMCQMSRYSDIICVPVLSEFWHCRHFERLPLNKFVPVPRKSQEETIWIFDTSEQQGASREQYYYRYLLEKLQLDILMAKGI